MIIKSTQDHSLKLVSKLRFGLGGFGQLKFKLDCPIRAGPRFSKLIGPGSGWPKNIKIFRSGYGLVRSISGLRIFSLETDFENFILWSVPYQGFQNDFNWWIFSTNQNTWIWKPALLSQSKSSWLLSTGRSFIRTTFLHRKLL